VVQLWPGSLIRLQRRKDKTDLQIESYETRKDHRNDNSIFLPACLDMPGITGTFSPYGFLALSQ
jgi:hypothetical protein